MTVDVRVACRQKRTTLSDFQRHSVSYRVDARRTKVQEEVSQRGVMQPRRRRRRLSTRRTSTRLYVV